MSDSTFMYALRVRKDPTAIERITSTLRRRGHELVALTMRPGEEPDMFDVTLEIRPKAGRKDFVATDLLKVWAILDARHVAGWAPGLPCSRCTWGTNPVEAGPSAGFRLGHQPERT